MAPIVGFLVVHVALALLVPKTIGADDHGRTRGRSKHEQSRRDEATPQTCALGAAPCLRTPSPSIFRPRAASTRARCEENKALVEDINRRKLLRGAVSLGALTMLTGCNVTRPTRCSPC